MSTDFASLKLRVDSLEMKAANKETEKFNRNAKETDKATRKMSSGFSSMASTLKTLAPAMAALAATYVSMQIVRVARETQNYIAQLKTMTGSLDNANIAFNRLNEFAKTTPYTLQQSIDGFVKLKALGLDPSERAMRSYGNTASAMGKSMQQMIEAVADASTNEFERLKEFGIKARQQGENVTFTFRGVETTIKKSADNIQQYLMNIGETDFSTAMADRMKTLDGEMSNLKGNLDNVYRSMGELIKISNKAKKVISLLSKAASQLNTFLRDQINLSNAKSRVTISKTITSIKKRYIKY